MMKLFTKSRINPITPSQYRALLKLEDGNWHSAYELNEKLQTMFALVRRGLVENHGGLGDIWSPRTEIKFCIKSNSTFIKE